MNAAAAWPGRGGAFARARAARYGSSIRFGVSFCNVRDVSAEQLLTAADAAMYRAKRGGRNKVELALPT